MSKEWSKEVHDVSERRHQRTEREWEAERKRLLDVIEEQEKALDTALGIADQISPPALIELAPMKKAEATAVAVASDWHVEETVDPKTINYLNEFNLRIAETRVKQLFRNIIRLAGIQRHGSRIDRLVLSLTGDLMTGYIHEELQEENGMSPTETVLWLQDMVAGGIRALAPEFEEIVVVCNYGNHGRTSKKPRHATGAKNSYEWMLYHFLERELDGIAQWHIADGYHQILDVDGRKIRFHHGDGLRYQGGVGGLTIPVEKAIAAWNKAITCDLDVFGHWHQSQQNPKWVCNGSLIGFNAYSIAIKAPYEKPSQTFFLMDKKYGRTITAPIFLEKP